MIAYFVQHALAGSWSLIWHWGLGIGVIILLIFADVFSASVPIIGPRLYKVREWMTIAAIGIGLVLVGEWIGVHDMAKRCKAETVVVDHFITKTITKIVKEKPAPSADPYNSPNN